MNEQDKAEYVEAALSDGWLDEDGYPTDAALRRIETWPFSDAAGCLDFVRQLWSGYGLIRDTLSVAERKLIEPRTCRLQVKYVCFVTGGWSGNEALIAALNENIGVEMLWKLSASGGLHIYRYP